MRCLALTLLGGFHAQAAGGRAIDMPSRKAQALLAFLGLRPGQRCPRETAAALLWPDSGAEHARRSLRQMLFVLRRALAGAGVAALELRDEAIAFVPGAVAVDALDFSRLVAEGGPPALARAVDLYRGDLLEGVAVEAPPFEEWLGIERQRLREAAVAALQELLRHRTAAGPLEAAVQTALRLLALDPLQEAAHRALMRLHAAQGRRGAALRQYRSCAQILRQELGVEPEEETRALHRELLAQAQAGDAGPGRAFRAGRPAAARGIFLIGRSAEVATLRAALDAAWAGRGRVVMLLGEAGIGKTRLVEQLAHDVTAKAGRLLVGRSYESVRGLPFGPVVDVLRATVAHLGPDIEALAPVARAELTRLLPDLGDGRRARGASGGARLLDAIRELLVLAAARQPLALVVEDAQWADEMTLQLVSFLGRRLPPSRMLLMLTAREEDLADAPLIARIEDELRGEDRVVAIRLSPLSRAETAALVHALARPAPHVSPGLAERIWPVSQGNPFVAVETLRAVESGEIGDAEDGLPLPDRVRALVSARLDRLSGPCRRLVALAAVIGRECDYGVLAEVSGLADTVAAEAVEELIRRHVLVEFHGGLGFAHDRIAEVAYGRIPGSMRRALHRRVAAAVERLAGDARERPWAVLGWHYGRGQAWSRAADCLARAAAQAMSRSGTREAIRLFEQALGAVDHLEPDRRVRARRVDLCIALDHALLLAGEPARGFPHLREAERLAAGLGDVRRHGWVFIYLSEYFRTVGDHARAADLAERALERAGNAGDAVLAAESRLRLGQVYHAAGDYRRAADLLRGNAAAPAVADAPPARDDGPTSGPALLDVLTSQRANSGLLAVLSHAWLVWCLAELGEFSEAEARAGDCQRLAEDADVPDPFRLMLAALSLGRLRARQARGGEAVAALERCRALEREGDFRIWQPSIATSLGEAYLMAGRPEDAVAVLREAVAAAAGMQSRFGQALRLALLGRALAATGAHDEALGHARRALDAARSQGERGHEAVALSVLAWIAVLRGAPDAGVLGVDAIALADGLGMRPVATWCRGMAAQRRAAGTS